MCALCVLNESRYQARDDGGMDAILHNLSSGLTDDSSPIAKDILSLSSSSEGSQEFALRNIINLCLEGSLCSSCDILPDRCLDRRRWCCWAI